MKKYFFLALAGLLTLTGCNQSQLPAVSSIPATQTAVTADVSAGDNFDASKYVVNGATNISVVSLDLNGDGVPEKSVYYEHNGIQNVSLLMKTDGDYEEQNAYGFTHKGPNPDYLKEQRTIDIENDGGQELLFHFVSPSLENPVRESYAYVKYVEGAFKYTTADASFVPPAGV